MSSDLAANAAIVERLTRGITFEPGVNVTDFTFVESIGFLAVNKGGQEVGGFEVAGFMASRDGLYMQYGGYPDVVRPGVDLDITTHTADELVRKSQQYGDVGIQLGNTPLALEVGSTDSANNVVELWGAVVHPKTRDGRGFSYADTRVTNADLGRSLITRGDVRRWITNPVALGLGFLAVYFSHCNAYSTIDTKEIQSLEGILKFPEGSQNPSFRRLGTMRRRIIARDHPEPPGVQPF